MEEWGHEEVKTHCLCSICYTAVRRLGRTRRPSIALSESSNSPLGQDFRSLEGSGLHDLCGIRTDLHGVMGYEEMTDTCPGKLGASGLWALMETP